MSREGHTTEFKRMVLDAYENKGYSLRGIYQTYSVHHMTLMNWKKSVNKYGWEGFIRTSSNKAYPRK